jgi:hypothetical protein
MGYIESGNVLAVFQVLLFLEFVAEIQLVFIKSKCLV